MECEWGMVKINNRTKGTLEIIVASVGLVALGASATFLGPKAFREVYEGVRTASTVLDYLHNVSRSLGWSLYPAATVASVDYLLRGIEHLKKGGEMKNDYEQREQE